MAESFLKLLLDDFKGPAKSSRAALLDDSASDVSSVADSVAGPTDEVPDVSIMLDNPRARAVPDMGVVPEERSAHRVFGRVPSDSSDEALSGEGGGISRTESVASSPLFPADEAPPAESGQSTFKSGLPSLSGSPEKAGNVPSGGGVSGGKEGGAPAGEEGAGNRGGTGEEGGVSGGKGGTSSMGQFLGLLEDETAHQPSAAENQDAPRISSGGDGGKQTVQESAGGSGSGAVVTFQEDADGGADGGQLAGRMALMDDELCAPSSDCVCRVQAIGRRV